MRGGWRLIKDPMPQSGQLTCSMGINGPSGPIAHIPIQIRVAGGEADRILAEPTALCGIVPTGAYAIT